MINYTVNHKKRDIFFRL